MCFYDVMLTFRGERGASAAQSVAEAFTEAGAVVGQYEPLDERGVTALNYLVLGTSENEALTADSQGRLAHATDIKGLLRRVSSSTGAQIVYVTKLSAEVHDIDEFADIEDAEAAQNLVFRQARSVALGRFDQDWAARLAAVTHQDVHVLKSDGHTVALVDGGLDVSRLPMMDPTSAFVYSTPLAILARVYLPGRTLGETVHEVNFTWFAETTPLRSFAADSEVVLAWAETLRRLHSAAALTEEFAANPETAVPSDALELWSTSADLAVVESVLTAAGLPGRAVRLADHEGRAENLPGVTTIRAQSPEVLEMAEEHTESHQPERRGSVVVEQEASPGVAWMRCAVFLVLSAVCIWLAVGVFTSVPAIGMWILALVFAGIAALQGVRALRLTRARREEPRF